MAGFDLLRQYVHNKANTMPPPLRTACPRISAESPTRLNFQVGWQISQTLAPWWQRRHLRLRPARRNLRGKASARQTIQY